jgi:endonuclease-3
MTLKERYEIIFGYFKKNRPVVETELEYCDPYELIVAVILSAQCTDKRVNMITPALFSRYPDAKSLASAEPQDILEFIKSCSYPNNKSKNLSAMARMLVKDFGGTIPSQPEELMRLPGVGRKTANVLASVIYNKPVIAVDTHVFRVSNRLGLVRNAKTPDEVEKQLTHNIPEEMRHDAHHWLILHGRYICKARNPLCGDCGLKNACKYYQNSVAKKS